MCFSKKLNIIIAIIIVIILGGCSFNRAVTINREEAAIKILIDGTHMNPTLFEIVDENVIKVSRIDGVLEFIRFSGTTTMHPFLEYTDGFSTTELGQQSLSQQQLDVVWGLIENVVANGPDRAFRWLELDGPSAYVWMIVNGQTYWSFYHPNIYTTYDIDIDPWYYRAHQYINRNLLLLTYKLIELSPVPVGGENRPLQTPRDFR